jgi:MoxR-like ATPase
VKYATRLARATRPDDPRATATVKKHVDCGAGPRASQYLVLAAKAGAMLRGSVVVNSADVRAAAHPVLRHRIFTNFSADSDGVNPDKIIDDLIAGVPEPGERDYA